MDAEELRQLRDVAGLKSYKLAELLDLSPATLSRYERGHATIPRAIELAVRYLCEPRTAPHHAAERLVEAIKEVVGQ